MILYNVFKLLGVAMCNIDFSSYDRDKLGYAGELLACLILRKLNFKNVKINKDNFDGDIIASDIKFEVKTSLVGKDKTYRATLWKNKHTSHLFSDYIIWFVIDELNNVFTYIIPVSDVYNRNTLQISSHPAKYNGQWNKYLINS